MPLTIAVEGCTHGELDKIYETLEYIKKENSIEIDLLLCCGDFQAIRCPADLDSLEAPPKYRKMGSFYMYYTGEKTAPMLTIVIGGNHESSNYMWELGHGGWLAPNIYYLGLAGVVNFGGIRIGGLSGIYKPHDFYKGHFEAPPFNESTLRSVYHTRNFEVFQMKQVRRHIDMFMSHDWPNHITDFGDRKKLVRFKPYLYSDIEKGELGSPHTEQLLYSLKPSYWFAAHLHCKFVALVPHEIPESESKQASDAKRQKIDEAKKEQKFTKFLALNKCLPGKLFLQLVNIPDAEGEKTLSYDAEWLSIVKSTHEFYPLTTEKWLKPTQRLGDRWIFTPTDVEMEDIRKLFNHDLSVPDNFVKTVQAHDVTYNPSENPQTKSFCEKLGIVNHFKPTPLVPLSLLRQLSHGDTSFPPFPIQESPGAYIPYSPTSPFPGQYGTPLTGFQHPHTPTDPNPQTVPAPFPQENAYDLNKYNY